MQWLSPLSDCELIFCFVNNSFNSYTAIYINEKTSDTTKSTSDVVRCHFKFAILELNRELYLDVFPDFNTFLHF